MKRRRREERRSYFQYVVDASSTSTSSTSNYRSRDVIGVVVVVALHCYRVVIDLGLQRIFDSGDGEHLIDPVPSIHPCIPGLNPRSTLPSYINLSFALGSAFFHKRSGSGFFSCSPSFFSPPSFHPSSSSFSLVHLRFYSPPPLPLRSLLSASSWGQN